MNSALCTLSLFPASSLVLFHAKSASNDVVSDTCKKCAASNPNVNYDHCMKALGSDPKSRMADLHGLGAIALTLLERSKQDPYVRKCLSDCSDLYSDAAETAKEAVGAYQAKRYLDVQNSVTTDADMCESQFKEKQGVSSPLTKQNGDGMQLSYIELAIVAIVTGS
ncbi:putative invertase inhibitor [Syzygium oleosum]|uniref:putative invertase inhibitor n=1 Tax=Syzygium oleosum TaxID=219896 RepID=UPI0024BAFA1C|nr:putative invertase inhibitor [Syzygium oleosum]